MSRGCQQGAKRHTGELAPLKGASPESPVVSVSSTKTPPSSPPPSLNHPSIPRTASAVGQCRSETYGGCRLRRAAGARGSRPGTAAGAARCRVQAAGGWEDAGSSSSRTPSECRLDSATGQGLGGRHAPGTTNKKAATTSQCWWGAGWAWVEVPAPGSGAAAASSSTLPKGRTSPCCCCCWTQLRGTALKEGPAAGDACWAAGASAVRSGVGGVGSAAAAAAAVLQEPLLPARLLLVEAAGRACPSSHSK